MLRHSQMPHSDKGRLKIRTLLVRAEPSYPECDRANKNQDLLVLEGNLELLTPLPLLINKETIRE